jgi:hypothetical protein
MERPQESGPGLEHFNESQRAELAARQAGQDRTLAAMHRLKAALGAAARGRNTAWREDVMAAVAVLADAMKGEAKNAERPDSLLSDLARTQPRLRNRARGIRLQYGQLRDTLQSLLAELSGHPGGSVDFLDIRQQVGWVLSALRHQRARESDLIYEAYFDAFQADLVSEANGGDNRSG